MLYHSENTIKIKMASDLKFKTDVKLYKAFVKLYVYIVNLFVFSDSLSVLYT